MQKPVRRTDRLLSEEGIRALLREAEYGFLGTVDEDGAPYVTPLSFVCEEDVIYIHCALEGQKLDNIRRDGRVCFSVAGGTEVISKQFTTRYRSALVRGRAEMVEGEEKRRALLLLCQKYAPDQMDKAPLAIEKSFSRTGVIRIAIDSITGKAKQ